MFESLDDDLDFDPDDAFRAGVRRRGRALRRRRRSLATGLALTPVAAVAATALWTQQKLDDIDRVDITVGGPGGADDGAPPAQLSDEPLDVLVVGTDAGLRGEDRAEGEPRADAVLLVRLDPAADEVRAVSIPRDLWLEPQPGEPEGTVGERLAEVRRRGPAALVQRVEAALTVDGTGPGIDHYVELDGEGFARLVDLAGGVSVATSAPLRDRGSGLDLPAGCTRLDGGSALALARSRQLERRGDDGVWHRDTTSDVGRMWRGRELAHGLGAAVLGVETSPADLVVLIDLLADAAVVDTGLTVDHLAWWGWASALPEGAVRFEGLPTEPQVSDGEAAVVIRSEAAVAVLRWRSGAGDPPPTDAGRGAGGAGAPQLHQAPDGPAGEATVDVVASCP